MGNENSSIAKETGMLEADVQRLHEKFDLMRTGEKGNTPSHDLTIQQFVSKFPPQQEELAKMIFTAMDIDSSGMIDFREFCSAVAILSMGTQDEKINFVFTLYDSDRKGYISMQDMKRIVKVFKRSSEALIQSMQEGSGTAPPVPNHAANVRSFGRMNSGSGHLNNSGREQIARSGHNRSQSGGLPPALDSGSNSSSRGGNTPRTVYGSVAHNIVSPSANSGITPQQHQEMLLQQQQNIGGTGDLSLANGTISSTDAATQLFESMRGEKSAGSHVTKADFERWCLENAGPIQQQMDVTFNALKRAAYWDWEGKKTEDDSCVVM